MACSALRVEKKNAGVDAEMTAGDSALEEVLTGGLLRVSCLVFSLEKKTQSPVVQIKGATNQPTTEVIFLGT